MSSAILLIPDFALILFGFVLHYLTNWGRSFWDGLEKLVYYVLFPALLFNSIAKNHIDLATAGPALATTAIVMASGIVLALVGKWLLHPDERVFASAFQTAFRFNSYIGLAIMGRLYGETGIVAFGLVIAVAVPIANIASVWALARHAEKGFIYELIRNPLLLATLSGLLYSLSGLPLPESAQLILTRMGSASIALGLLAVGAALQFSQTRHVALLGGYLLGVKMLALPAVAILVGHALGVTGLYFTAVLVLAALPVATSAYVLANRMGGDGQVVAFLVSISTLIAMVTIPLWLQFVT
jgi:malonate transporter and related proteins